MRCLWVLWAEQRLSARKDRARASGFKVAMRETPAESQHRQQLRRSRAMLPAHTALRCLPQPCCSLTGLHGYSNPVGREQLRLPATAPRALAGSPGLRTSLCPKGSSGLELDLLEGPGTCRQVWGLGETPRRFPSRSCGQQCPKGSP